MRPFEVGQTVSLEIEKLTFGGTGLGRYQGFVVFVPFSAPGDSLKVRISKVSKNFAGAQIEEIIKPSEQRRTPPCPVFGICGGCDWQHVPYSTQLKEKEEIVRTALKKAKVSTNEFLPIEASAQEWRYRNRIQLHSDGKNLGFRKRASHDIVNIKDCPITDERITQEIPHLNAERSKRIDLRLTKSGGVSVTDGNEQVQELGFSQVNEPQNQQMIGTLVEWLRPFKFKSVLDLYAGNGNLTFPVYDRLTLQKATAVEMNTMAVNDGRNSKDERSIEFIEASVDDFLKKQTRIGDDEAVILDPPRVGCSELVIKKLAELAPKTIAYVSCDPMTWARDVSRLLQLNPQYKVLKVQSLDMFPQTTHIELMSLLGRE